jgi:hypothetical protein
MSIEIRTITDDEYAQLNSAMSEDFGETLHAIDAIWPIRFLRPIALLRRSEVNRGLKCTHVPKIHPALAARRTSTMTCYKVRADRRRGGNTRQPERTSWRRSASTRWRTSWRGVCRGWRPWHANRLRSRSVRRTMSTPTGCRNGSFGQWFDRLKRTTLVTIFTALRTLTAARERYEAFGDAGSCR